MGQRQLRRARQSKKKAEKENTSKYKYPYAKVTDKMKAFLTDSFMLVMPIMYTVVYLFMGGREGFAEHKLLGWIAIFVPLIIVQTIFMTKTAQTPGYRAYNLKLIDEFTGEKPTLFIIVFRNFCAMLSFFTFFGWTMMFFRKDAKTLHDLLSRTAIIRT